MMLNCMYAFAALEVRQERKQKWPSYKLLIDSARDKCYKCPTVRHQDSKGLKVGGGGGRGGRVGTGNGSWFLVLADSPNPS